MMIRARFSKKKRLRYISHLELMDTMRRAIRRADVPGAYSKGYNPSLNLSLSQPLPVGMPGGGEYLDLELIEAVGENEFVSDLNKKLPSGVEILVSRLVENTGLKSLQAIVDRARYIISSPLSGRKSNHKLLAELSRREELFVVRRRRNKEDRSYDLRSMIHEVNLREDNCWSFLVSTGSRGNVRPGEIVQGLKKLRPELPDIPLINFYREGMYVAHNDDILTPLSEVILEGR